MKIATVKPMPLSGAMAAIAAQSSVPGKRRAGHTRDAPGKEESADRRPDDEAEHDAQPHRSGDGVAQAVDGYLDARVGEREDREGRRRPTTGAARAPCG